MRAWVMTCSVAVSVGLAIGAGCTTLLEGHCANQDGDATCVSSGLGRYCNKCVGAASGCSEEMPAEGCYFAGEAGTTGDGGEGGTGSSGVEGTTGEVSTGETAGSGTTGTGTTGTEPCVSSEECTGPEAPFCGVMGVCGTCEMTADPDGECAGVDPLSPLCVAATCVECTPEDPAVCDEMLLVCDGDTNSCVPCTEHAQCASGACELAVGTCFPNDMVVHVDGDGGQDFTSVVAAVNSIGDGMHGVIVVHEFDGGANYYGYVLIDGGKVIALLAAPEEQPIMQGPAMLPSISVTGVTTALYIDALRLVGNTNNHGLHVESALAWVDRSQIVQNAGGGILAENGAELTLRNCFVGDGTNDDHALWVESSSANVLSTTLGAGLNNFEDIFPVFCTGTTNVTIRNSLLVSFDGISEISCEGADITNTASDTLINGRGNVELGNVGVNWFVGVADGDFHLDSPPAMLDTTALWMEGDPTTDIDGDSRPTADASPDYAGADVP